MKTKGPQRANFGWLKLGALFLFAVLSDPASAVSSPGRDAKAEAERLGRFWNDVLAMRVDRILEGRQNAMSPLKAACFGLETEIAVERKRGRAQGLGTGAVGAEVPIALMGAYQLTEAAILAGNSCGRAMAAADLSLYREERSPFEWALDASGSLPRQLRLALAELDPWCAVGVAADLGRSKDGNPCFAGELPILYSLLNLPVGGRRANSDPFSQAGQEIDGWLKRFVDATQRASRGDRIDLLALAPSNSLDSESSRRRLLAEVTYLYVAASFEVGWVDGFAERFWSGPLRDGAPPVEAYSAVMTWMNRKQLFTGFRNHALGRGVRLYWGEREVTGWNHHDFISAFMGCDFQERGLAQQGRAIPHAIGIAYESKDFISHLREGDGWSASVGNFQQDVERHVEGAAFGQAFCRPQQW